MTARPVTIPHSHRHVLASKHVGRKIEVWVAEPVAGPVPLPEGPRAVLYVLDGDLFFGTAVETSRLMSQLYGELPPLLVVGIAYGEEPSLQGQLRTRDFTPSADPGYDRMAAAIPGFEPLLPEGSRMGGADRFLAFVREELQPFVAERYDVAPGESAVYGSSLGGLFAAYTLLRAPETFSRYLIASPALWWNGDEVLTLAEDLERKDLGARVYLAAGSREEDPAVPMLASYKLVTNTRELARRLEAKNLPSLRLTVDVLEGETHTSAVPVSMARGLRAAYGGR
jgi:predicted alpha/beta superfamily hydrolase